jgi:hypothetical protein
LGLTIGIGDGLVIGLAARIGQIHNQPIHQSATGNQQSTNQQSTIDIQRNQQSAIVNRH